MCTRRTRCVLFERHDSSKAKIDIRPGRPRESTPEAAAAFHVPAPGEFLEAFGNVGKDVQHA
jgi:hypothetical protein